MSTYSYDDIIGEFKLRSEKAFKDYQEVRERRSQELKQIQYEVSYMFDKRKAKKMQASGGKTQTISDFKEVILDRLNQGHTLYEISKEIGYQIKTLSDYLQTVPEYVDKYRKKKTS